MRLVKDVDRIPMEDRKQALAVMNKLKAGNRVFGSPAEGLKWTLKHLEQRLATLNDTRGKLDFMVNDGDVKQEIALVKAGITGEETLAEWFERITKYDELLEDLVVFASLSDPEQDSGNGEYISDSDFVALYGTHALILDAKNIRTNPEVPIYIDNGVLLAAGGAEIMELHPSTHIWKRIFHRSGCQIEGVKGCVVIVNQSGATVWKNQEWHQSDVQPLHISDLVKYLHEWVDSKENVTYLSTITALSKMQIRPETAGVDMSDTRRRFGI